MTASETVNLSQLRKLRSRADEATVSSVSSSRKAGGSKSRAYRDSPALLIAREEVGRGAEPASERDQDCSE